MYNTILLTDFYKVTHLMQFSPKISRLTSYLTPRSSRLNTTKEMIWFGVSGFVNNYLFKNFNENFFNKDFKIIEEEIYEVLHYGLRYDKELIQKTINKIKELWDLHYLPIEINALPEGTKVPMGVPALEIRTTVDGFAWVTQNIESILSCTIWHPCVSATVAYEYAKIAKKAFNKTVDDNISWQMAMCDFSMRGQESYESAVASSAAWLTCFYNSSTVGVRNYIKENYSDNIKDVKILGLTSTEHSVMTSDIAINGEFNERETYRRLLTEVYPNINFSVVADSRDFWNVVTNVLPSLREEIEAHKGFLGVRHDSAEPVEALCGLPIFDVNQLINADDVENRDIETIQSAITDALYDFTNDCRPNDWCDEIETYVRAVFKTNRGTFDKVYRVIPEVYSERGAYTNEKHYFIESYEVECIRDTTWQDKGMVETLYELFGGTYNSKGYKVMNPKLKAVYGDSITIPRARTIYDRLAKKGFAANNVSLGVGSFSMEAIEENGALKPFTRDTFSIAIKATHGTTFDGKEIEIYKDPKGFSLKKSLRGLCVPVRTEEGLSVIQRLNEEQRDALDEQSEYINYFKDDTINPYITFWGIRELVEINLDEEV